MDFLRFGLSTEAWQWQDKTAGTYLTVSKSFQRPCCLAFGKAVQKDDNVQNDTFDRSAHDQIFFKGAQDPLNLE